MMEWVVLTVTSSTPGTFRAIFVTSTITSLSMRSERLNIAHKNLPVFGGHPGGRKSCHQRSLDLGSQAQIFQGLPGFGRCPEGRPIDSLEQDIHGILDVQGLDVQDHVVEPAVRRIRSVEGKAPLAAFFIILFQCITRFFSR